MPGSYVTTSIGAVLIALQGVHAQSSQQQTPAPADATFKVEVNYVEEDVRVVDRAGNVIRGLKSADFQVAEDGRPQKVVAFAAVDIPFVPREQPRDAGPAAAPVEPDHKGPGKTTALDVLIETSGTDLTFKENDGVFYDTISFSVKAFDRQGKGSAGERFDIDLKLKAESHARAIEHGVRVVRTLAIAPGQYGLRIAAQDSVGAKRGSVRFDVEVPDFSMAPVAMSGVALASAASPAFTSWNKAFGDALPAAPTAIREFPAGDELAAFVEVYDNKPTPTHGLDMTTTVKADDGKTVLTHHDERSTDELHGVPGGFGYATRIPLKDWSPGLYVLTIEAKSRMGDSPAISRIVPFKVR